MVIKKKKRRGRGKSIGNAWERFCCSMLSLWWTGGERDDVFSKSDNSGGRATARNKLGKKTYGHHGDVCVSDPIGKELIETLTFEVKKGYTKNSFADLLDKPSRAKEQLYEEWIRKASKSCKVAGTLSWVLITKRNNRNPIVLVPSHLVSCIQKVTAKPLPDSVFIIKWLRNSGVPSNKVFVFLMEEFFNWLSPKHVKAIHKELIKEK